MQTTRRTLSDGWRMRQVPDASVPAHNRLPWLPAQVPGHAHLDLERAGVIPDPFDRLHERDVAWVDEADWIYEVTFHVDDPVDAQRYLLFHGIDTIAEILLNGQLLGSADNMYVLHEFPVNGILNVGEGDAGQNTLTVTFRSAERVGLERQAEWNRGPDPVPLHWDSFGARSMVRKAQYMYGWDWGPVLRGCGLWQPVELVIVPIARILDWKHDVEFKSDDQAIVTITADIERGHALHDESMEFHIELASDPLQPDGAAASAATAMAVVQTGVGRKTVTATVVVDNPRLWMPNGSGAEAESPTCYSLSMHVKLSGSPLLADAREMLIGLRTIALVREPDADGQGEGFKFRVNGQDIFIKGANWIPNDSFAATITEEELRERITQARDAGFNMLRVWGGGFYESENFYTLCDELGILVWQDFAYACAYYPDTGEYAEAARAEATAAVKRIRNHPSLALWCGNNENSMMYYSNWHGAKPARFIGENLYNDVLPRVIAEYDPKTPYWPSSPFGGEDPNSPKRGDCHNWDVWHGRGDWVHYTENDSRFCSEFGFAASCGLAAWETVLADTDKHPLSQAVRWHDKTRKGYDTYLGYIALHYPEPQTMEDLVYFSQINQAEALKFGIEHYRRRKGHCWGTLFWQLNDCWPAQSWSIIDYLGEPKAAYYAAKKFYAPVLLSLVREGSKLTAHLINDHTHAVSGELALSVASLDGAQMLGRKKFAVQVGPNGAEAVATYELPATSIGSERDLFVHGIFQPGTEGEPVENIAFLAEPKDLRLSDPGLRMIISQESQGTFSLSITAQRFAPYVWLRRTDNIPLQISDNFFHLRPEETRRILIENPAGILTVEELRGALVLRSL